MSEVKVNKVSPRTGTDVTVGGKLITESNGDLNLYPNGTGAVEVGGNTNPGTIILNCESNSHGIKLQSPPHSAGQSYTMKFPSGNITAGKFLKVDSITGSGATAVGQMSFADAGGGKVLQVVSNTASGTCSTTSSTFTDATNCPSLDITPSATTSKIFLIASIGAIENSGATGAFTIFRDSTNLGDSSNGFGYLQPDGTTYLGGGANFLDSPSSTSSINYEIRIKNTSGGASTTEISRGTTKATLTAFEIGV
jgi:hypothetical protein